MKRTGARSCALCIAAAIAVTIGAPAAFAADDSQGRVTFHKDVAPILQENCQTCHRPAGDDLFGMVAPMSLMTFEETRPWAKAIAREVQSRRMPPWHASEQFDGVFENERRLGEKEIAVIQRWARSGAPAGRAADAPAPRAFAGKDGWIIGEPDLIVSFEKPFFVKDEVRDLYQNVIVTLTPEQLPEDRWIRSLQFKPDSAAVHHIVIFATAPGQGLGFDGVDAQSEGVPSGMLGGFGPGTDPSVFPEGYGRLLRAGSTIVFNMHYHKESGPGTGVWDRSRIGFKFHDKPVRHAVIWGGVSNSDFEIPAYHPNWTVGAAQTFDEDITLLALFPHMHLRGKAAHYQAVYPDGRRESLLDVPAYDFNWQTNYVLKEPKRLPAGTRIEVKIVYDNSAENAERAGFNAARQVRNGGPTTDEMAIGFIDYCLTEPIETASGGD